MKWSSWILFAGALALVFGVVAMVTRQSSSTPADYFAGVRLRIARGVDSKEQILVNLDQCLQLAEDAGDLELETRVRRERGLLLTDLGAYDRARADLQEVARRDAKDAIAARALVDLELRAEQYDAARRLLDDALRADPVDGALWSHYARAWRAEAQHLLERCSKRASALVVADSADAVRRDLVLSAAIEDAPARRAFLAQRIVDALENQRGFDAPAMLGDLDRANECNTRARRAAARSIELSGDADAALLYAGLCVEAGDMEEAAVLAIAAERSPALRVDSRLPVLLLPALRADGRRELVADLAQSLAAAPVRRPAAFWHEACVSLYTADRWDPLHGAALGLRGAGSLSDIAEGDFWIGMALGRGGFCQDAERFLNSFLKTMPPDPVPHARALAHQAAARCAHEAGRLVDEREHLRGFVQEWPDGDGEAWLRLADLTAAAENAGWRDPVEQQAKAIELLPARADELLPRWIEWGERQLQLVGFDRNDLGADRGVDGPTSYELYRSVQLWLEKGDAGRAGAANRRLLLRLPKLLPALDLAVEIAVAAGRERDIVEAVAARVARGGRTARIDELLAGIDAQALTSKSRLALIETDPSRLGRLLVAEDLLERGDTASALASLESIAADMWTDDARVLAAKLRLERGEASQAADLLLPAKQAVASMPGVFELGVEALARAGRTDDLRAFLVEHAKSVAPKRLLSACDLLLRHRQAASALLLARQLDSTAATRGAETLLRLMGAQLATGQLDIAHGTLERLQAFDVAARAARLGLVLGSRSKDDELAADMAAQLKPLGDAAPLVGAQLALLGREPAAAQAMLAKLPPVQGTLRDPLRFLVEGAVALQSGQRPAASAWMGVQASAAAQDFFAGAKGERDPRQAVVWLLAHKEPLASASIQQELLDGVAPLPGGLWERWLAASLRLADGDTEGARALAAELVQAAPDFGPAWEILRTIGFPGTAGEREQAAFELKRMEGLGGLACEPWERSLLEGVFQLLDGSPRRALELAERALDAQPASVRAARLAALASATLKDDARLDKYARAALEPRKDAVDALTKREAAQLVDAVLQRTLAAAKDDPQSKSGKALWDDLAARRADDPLSALAAARMDLLVDPRNPATGVDRAMGRLQRFRKQNQKTCLDDLAPGATSAWSAFHAELDPDAALAFLRAERELQPALAATWLEEPQVLARAGRPSAAAEASRRADILVPGSKLARPTFALAMHGEMKPDAIEQALAEIPVREGAAGPDPELALMAAHAYANLGARHAARLRDLHLAVQEHIAVWKKLESEWLLLGLRLAAVEGGEALQTTSEALLRQYADLKPAPRELEKARVLRGMLREGAPQG